MAAASGTENRALAPELVEILACPACDDRPPVTLDEAEQHLSCDSCGRRYPVRGGIPVMLVDEAITD
jgi:uncharacterized protein YbaR (Trm112 family)